MRAIDRLDPSPRFTESDAIDLNRQYRAMETEECKTRNTPPIAVV